MNNPIQLSLYSIIRSLAVALGATLAVSLLPHIACAGVTNNFTGGLGQNTSVVDAYPGMPGDGWVDAWTFGSGGSGTGQLVLDGVTNTRPFEVGGDYLRYGVYGAESALRRKYTSTEDLDLSLPHIIEFDLRCDAWLPSESMFTSGNDNITLTARVAYGNNPSGDSTFYIRAQGADNSGPPNGRKNMWGFFDGGEFSNANEAGTFTNNPPYPFRIGTNYHFKIEQRPPTKTYIATISAVVDGVFTNMTTKELRWRSYSTVTPANQTNGTVLHFIARPSSSSGETNVIALDNLHIYQAPLDDVPPLIGMVSPAPGAIFYPTNGGITFTVRTLGPTNSIAPGDIHLTLNGVDVSENLVINGTERDRTANYGGNLTANIVYESVIVASDQAGRGSTNIFWFDTLLENEVVTLEAENYNFGTNAICNPNGTSTPGDFYGCYLQNPLPSTYNNATGLYTNKETGYVDRVGQNGVDFFDYNTSGGNLSSNAFRFCDPVGTIVTMDYLRPAYIAEAVPDYALQHIQQGEWWNYTHTFAPGVYQVYLRLSSTALAGQEFELAHVTSDRALPNQTTLFAGHFNVPYIAGSLNVYKYVPLTDPLGQPRFLPLSGENTLRMTASKVRGSEYVNFMLLSPQPSAIAPPWLSHISPAANASNVAPQTAISITVQNGSAPVATNTIALFVNGSNVTGSATIESTATGATVEYLPPTIFPMGSLVNVQFVAGDGSPSSLTTNQWTFHTGRYLPGTPVRVNFQPATFSPTPAGYMADIGKPFGDRGNGYNYGWDSDIQGQARDRGSSGNPPDDRYRTLNQLGNTTNLAQTRYWEIDLPNGTYNVHLVAGDGNAIDSVYCLAVEGTIIIPSNTPTAEVRWFEGSCDVIVADGRLTVSAAGGINNKVCFIDIVPAGPALDLFLHNARITGSNLIFEIATINRATHIIEANEDLSSGTWLVLTNIVGTGSSVTVIDKIGGQRFYRMRIP